MKQQYDNSNDIAVVGVTSVPLLDLKPQYQAIKDEVKQAIDRVLESQYFILGPEVSALEEEIAQYCGVSCAVGVSSGTDALLAAFMALGVSTGDEVITTPFTFFATLGSIMRLGAVPVLVDIKPDSFNIDVSQVEKALSARTKAILPIHLFGQSADMEPLKEIAERRGVALIEDAAQAIGMESQGRRAGAMGTMGCFSFFPSKNLGGFGDGGIVTTNDEQLAEAMRVIRNQGSKPKYHHKIIGGNFRLDAIQAAVLRVKLKYLDSWIENRRQNAAFYTRRFQEEGLVESGKVTPPPIVQEKHTFNQYVIRAKERDRLKDHLESKGVGTEIYYPKPMHLQECMGNHYRKGDFPVAEEAADAVLALPIFPELTMDQKEYVVDAILDFYRAG